MLSPSAYANLNAIGGLTFRGLRHLPSLEEACGARLSNNHRHP